QSVPSHGRQSRRDLLLLRIGKHHGWLSNTSTQHLTTSHDIKRRSNDGDCTDVVPWGGSMARSRTALGLLALPPGGLVLTSALATGGRRLLTGSANHGGDPAAAVAGLASVAAAAITAWLTLCLLLTLAAELPGAAGAAAGRVRDRITPVLVRRWAAVVLGASVTATLLPGTAVAAAPAATEPAPGPESTDVPADTPSPGWAPGPWPDPTTLPASGFSPGAPRTTVPPPTSAPAPGWTPRRPLVRQRAD